jgi:hypothetical protein
LIEDEKHIEGRCHRLYLPVLSDPSTIRRTHSAKNGFSFFCDRTRDDADDDAGATSAPKDSLGRRASGDEEIDGPCLRITVMRQQTSGVTTQFRSVYVLEGPHWSMRRHRRPRYSRFHITRLFASLSWALYSVSVSLPRSLEARTIGRPVESKLRVRSRNWFLAMFIRCLPRVNTLRPDIYRCIYDDHFVARDRRVVCGLLLQAAGRGIPSMFGVNQPVK